MEYNSEILQELKEISPLLSQIENKNPYIIASSYFSALPGNVLNKIKADDEAFSSFTRINPYTAPANYFNRLSDNIIKKLNVDEDQNEVFAEMEEISPLLNTISKSPVYSTPPHYFNDLTVPNDARVEKTSKFLYFRRSKKMLSYAVAAIIIGLLFVGIFLVTGKEGTSTANVKTLPEVNRLSEQEIVDFLKTTSPADNVVISTSKSNKKDVDIKRMVDEMSDKEIQQFLEENGEKNEM
jgi:flagellar assembly factor FliW